jgi:hypothetical protein
MKLHVNPAWICTKKDFEHATNSESIQIERRKGIPIIFHFASEEMINLENYGTNNMDTDSTSIHSGVSLRNYTILNLYIVILFEFFSYSFFKDFEWDTKERIIAIRLR